MPHECRASRYVAAKWKLPNGTTAVGFEISADGSVANVSVIQSSGDPDLDQMSVDCVKTWRYAPATKDGVAVAVPWKTAIVWKSLPGRPPSPPAHWIAIVLALQKCAKTPAPTDDQLKNTGATWLAIQFDQGKVVDVSVLTASGNPDLDARALNCAKTLSSDLTGDVPGKEKDELAFTWRDYRLWRTW